MTEGGHHQDAAAAYRVASRSEDPAVRLPALTGLANALAATEHRRDAIEYYQQAAALTGTVGFFESEEVQRASLAKIHEKAATQLEALDRLAEAADRCQAADELIGSARNRTRTPARSPVPSGADSERSVGGSDARPAAGGARVLARTGPSPGESRRRHTRPVPSGRSAGRDPQNSCGGVSLLVWTSPQCFLRQGRGGGCGGSISAALMQPRRPGIDWGRRTGRGHRPGRTPAAG